MSTHTVYLVSAGPGDPELLTVKAHRLLKTYPEVVLHDRLISPEILKLIPKRAEKIYVGKWAGGSEMKQAEIQALMIKHARAGKKIIRLKGGDAFIFGRGGEEIEVLTKAKLKWEVVPGITSAGAIAAALGIPLTHRGLAESVRYISGHKQAGKKFTLKYKQLADPALTLVVYMGLENIGMIAEGLMKAGLSPKTGAAAIQNGTQKNERRHFTNLGKLAADIARLKFASPTLFIIGEVVTISKKWRQ